MRITHKNEAPLFINFVIMSYNGYRRGSDKTLVEGGLCLYVTINLVLLQELTLDEEYTLPEMLLTLFNTQVDQGLATYTLHGSWSGSIVLAIGA